jgi:hypothetical protein
LPQVPHFYKELPQQPLVTDKAEVLDDTGKMSMVFAVAIVVSKYPAVISRTKSVIDEGQVVSRDPA